VLAASGAYLVGFGAPLDLFGSNPLLLASVTIVIGASATLGSVAAAHSYVAVLAVAALGALCGLAASRDTATAWIGLQCALAGVIATSYPASPAVAAKRALIIVSGGFTQTVLLSLVRFARRRAPPPPGPTPEPAQPRYALHLAVALAVGLGVERLLAIRNGYWVPATTLLVLRPTTQGTMTRALARSVGTLVGVSAASALLLAAHPQRGLLATLVTAAAFGAYTFQKATYGLFSACVGAYVVLIMSLGGSPEREVAVARMVATLTGAAVGLAVQFVDGALGNARIVRSRGMFDEKRPHA
jgi:hypothetical protein